MRKMQPSFAAGELSPSLWARVDMAKFHVGARTLRNMIVHPHGGASNRPGTKFITELYSPGDVRLIPFEFSVEQAYMLVFTDYRLRVVKDGGLVIRSLRSAEYMWVASGAVANEYYLERIVGDPDPSFPEPQTPEFFINGAVPVKGTPGTLAAGTWGWGDLDGLGYNTVYLRLADDTDPDTKALGYVSCIAVTFSPFASADLRKLRYTQSSDTVFLTHPSYTPQMLTRTDHHAWTFTAMSFDPGLAAPTGLTATPTTGGAARTYSYMVAQVQAGAESEPSSVATATIADPWASGVRINLAWAAASGAESYEVYKNSRGQWGWIGRTTGTTFVDDNIDPDVTFAPRSDAVKDFTAANGRPGAVALFQQRLALGRSNDAPAVVWMSRIGDLRDFTISDPLRDDDTIEAKPASGRVDEIRHLVPFDGLLLFTAGAEWVLRGADGTVRGSNLEFNVQSYYGSSDVQPLVVGKSVLFVQRDGRIVRDFAYNLEADGYSGNDLTIMARHLTEDYKISDWAYARDPDGVVWCVREDGNLLGLTFMKEHDVYAWTRHDTQYGAFKSVGVIPGATGGDEVYFCVVRTLEVSPGVTVSRWYLEKLSARTTSQSLPNVFLDSALVYQGGYTATLSGLDHLENQEVTAVINGNVVTGLTVSGGEVTLPYPDTGVPLDVTVGLPYVSELETLDLDTNQSEVGSNQGRRQKVSSLVVRLKDTRGLWAGPDMDHLVEIPFRTFEGYNEPTALFTGDKPISITPQWGRSAKVSLRQTYPLPVTVLGVLPELEVGG